MRISSIAKFSWKNLWNHRSRSFLTVGGVSIGVAAILFLVSLGYGLERLVTSQVATFKAFTMIDIPSANPPAGKINQESIERLKQITHVQNLERIVDLAGRVRLAEQNSTTETVVVGISPNYFKLADITISTGQPFKAEAVNEVVINKSLAGLLGFSDDPSKAMGQKIALDMIIPKSLRTGDSVDGPMVKENIELTVVGLTEESQNPAMYVSQSLTDQQGVVNSTSMKIQVDDKEYVPPVRKQIENTGFATEYVGDTVDQITQVFSIFRIVLGGFGLIALVVAAIGTFNTLTISLIERIREVSLLKMMGMKRNDVFKLFISESLTIGVMGGLIGAGVGLGIGYVANMIVSRMATNAGADAVTLFYTPWIFVLIVSGVSVLVGFVTGIYPSYKAIKTNPLDALRYE